MATYIVTPPPPSTAGSQSVDANSFNIEDGWARFYDGNNNIVAAFPGWSVAPAPAAP